MVANFSTFKDRESVRQFSKQLTDSNIGISEQFPMEIQERRRTLISVMKEAKQNGKRANESVEKLYIAGKIYIAPHIKQVTDAHTQELAQQSRQRQQRIHTRNSPP